MIKFLLLLFLFSKWTNAATPFINSFLDEISRDSMKKVFDRTINSRSVSEIHYSIRGLSALGVILDSVTNDELCKLLKMTEIADIKDLFHMINAASGLNNCHLTGLKEIQEMLEKIVNSEKATAKQIFHALVIAKESKRKVDGTKLANLLQMAVKEDTSAASLAYTLNAASFFEEKLAEPFFTYTTDFISQADEVDGKYLQLESGPSVTAFGVIGIYTIADKLNKSPNIKSDEAVKLTNYLLSRKNTQAAETAYVLLTALKKLANNNFQVPVVFSLASPNTLTDVTKPIKLRVSNVFGESVGALSVNLDSVTHVASKEVIETRKPLSRVQGDGSNTLYEYKMVGAKKRGLYNLAITAGSQDKRLIGTNGVFLSVRVLAKVRIEDITLAAYDRELPKPTIVHSIKESSKLGKVLDLDMHSKMELKFLIRDAASNDRVVVHQAFVAFVHAKTKREIIFVATPDSSQVYLFDMDVEKSVKDFEGLSGKYNVRLIIGDSAISTAFDWIIADVDLKIPRVIQQTVKKSEQIIYEKLPEIQHIFREPEKRPSQIISDTFTALCAVPFLILLILWLRIGINFGNMPLSIFTPLFHIGLIGIFVLYFVFWLQLNMFQTLKYLSAIGSLAFFAGNRLLRLIASKRKEKAD